MRSWFGKEPVWLVNSVVGALIAIVALAPWDRVVTAAAAAVITTVGGLVIAFAVVRRGELAAILGFVKAGLALLVLLGWHVDDVQQALMLGAVEAVAGIFLSTQVTAPIGPNGQRRSAELSTAA